MKKLAYAFVISILVIGGVPMNVKADTVIQPSSDAYTNQKFVTLNYNASGLVTRYESQASLCTVTQRVYLRFSLSSLEKNVGEQTSLRLYIATPPSTSGTLGVFSTTDDWNGSGLPGSGDETTLTWGNAPAPITELDTKASGTSKGWVQFSGSNLANYLNSQRAANGGDEVASFAIQWMDCTNPLSGFSSFEDRENSLSTGNTPILYPASPTAITINSFMAANPISQYTLYLSGLAILALMSFALLRYRARKINHSH